MSNLFTVRPATDAEMLAAPIAIDPATVGGNQTVMLVVGGPFPTKAAANRAKLQKLFTPEGKAHKLKVVPLYSANATPGHCYRSGS